MLPKIGVIDVNVVKFDLREGSLDFIMSDGIGEIDNFLNIDFLTAVVYAFEIVDKLKKLKLVWVLEASDVVFEATDDSKSNEDHRKLLLIDNVVEKWLDEIKRKRI